MDSLNLTYNKRCVDFFFKSIQDLKSQSGGQRWNAICEDAVDLFFHRFPKEIGENPFTREELWKLFFDLTDEELYNVFLNLSKRNEFLDFLFLILQAFLDPPAAWWNYHFK